MTDPSPHSGAQPALHVRQTGWGALLSGLAIFGLLWILYLPWRDIYMPPDGDTLPLLVDGLLLVPGAHWQDWFTRGYSHLWDLYPDWRMHGGDASETAFTRPGFQFVIYLAHFVLGKDWASYQLINNIAIAGMGAFTFHIAQTLLGLRTALSLVATILVLLSPPVLDSWWLGAGFAIEPLATIFVTSAFLAALARRDFLCLGLLFGAILTKENALWAPFAAAVTIVLRPKPDESFARRVSTAAVTLLPVAMWFGFRFVFFGGIGGTYATARYTPLSEFLKLIFHKLTHLHYLFVVHTQGMPLDRGTALIILDRATALIVYALLCLWALRTFTEVARHLRHAAQAWQADAFFLVALWAAFAVAFHLALPLRDDRYATSIVIFAWPALLAEVERRGKAIIWLGLASCCILSLTRGSYLYTERMTNPARADYRSMEAVLRQVPVGTKKIYVLSAGRLQRANPEHVRLSLGVPADIVRLSEIDWNCPPDSDRVRFDHSISDGVVSLRMTLPSCANFFFDMDRNFESRRIEIADGRVHRNDELTYELPEAYSRPKWWWNVGRRMIVHVRPNGPARFVIEHGGPNGIAWFDTP